MKLISLILCLCTFGILNGKIVEVSHFNEIASHTTSGTCVILDIDDTLLIPIQMLGCDEWFQLRLRTHRQAGMEAKEALEKSLAEWESVRHVTKMEIVEQGTEKIIQEMQKKSLCIMGLTTQGLALATRTSQQLLENEIDLSLTAPSKGDHYFQLSGHGILYRNGILFTSGRNKGEALFLLLDQMGYHPKRILFINDKGSHLAEVEAVAQKRSVEFIGLRYAFSDARKRAFLSEVAEYQFSHSSFNHLVSDKEAIEKMGSSLLLTSGEKDNHGS